MVQDSRESSLAPQEVAALDRQGPDALRAAGCTCEFGCRNCGYDEAQMGNCAAWNPCPMGRAKGGGCPVHGDE